MTGEQILLRIDEKLHERFGECGHCGLFLCGGKKTHSVIPATKKILFKEISQLLFEVREEIGR